MKIDKQQQKIRDMEGNVSHTWVLSMVGLYNSLTKYTLRHVIAGGTKIKRKKKIFERANLPKVNYNCIWIFSRWAKRLRPNTSFVFPDWMKTACHKSLCTFIDERENYAWLNVHEQSFFIKWNKTQQKSCSISCHDVFL